MEGVVRLECADENDLVEMWTGSDLLDEDRKPSGDASVSGSSKEGTKPEEVFLTIAYESLCRERSSRKQDTKCERNVGAIRTNKMQD